MLYSHKEKGICSDKVGNSEISKVGGAEQTRMKYQVEFNEL